MKEKAGTLLLAVGILLLGSAFLKRAELEQAVYTVGTAKEQTVVVIDAGHGGKDPGKVGTNNALEKDINLSIALRLKNLLERCCCHFDQRGRQRPGIRAGLQSEERGFKSQGSLDC